MRNSSVEIFDGGARSVCAIGAASVPSAAGRASRWPSCEWSRAACGLPAASGWRLIRRPARPMKRNDII
jgi:hypothetical protein